jgi:hypothetical protein
VFLSYSHEHDRSYVDRLDGFLYAYGVITWYDRELHHGDSWVRVLQEQIDSCAALVVVMTPEAEASEWVRREIQYARNLHRPILTLLLRGRPFFQFADMQYEDVADSQLPSVTFVEHLRTLVATAGPAPAPSVEPPAATPKEDRETHFPHQAPAGRPQLAPVPASRSMPGANRPTPQRPALTSAQMTETSGTTFHAGPLNWVGTIAGASLLGLTPLMVCTFTSAVGNDSAWPLVLGAVAALVTAAVYVLAARRWVGPRRRLTLSPGGLALSSPLGAVYFGWHEFSDFEIKFGSLFGIAKRRSLRPALRRRYKVAYGGVFIVRARTYGVSPEQLLDLAVRYRTALVGPS